MQTDEAALIAAKKWMGFATVAHDCTAKPDNKQKKSPYEIQTIATRKLIKGLTVCLKSGMKNNRDIYKLLMERGFLDKEGDRTVSRSTVNAYLRAVRERMGLVRKDKKTMICELFEKGEGIQQIAELINSTPIYVYQTLKNNGYQVKCGVVVDHPA